MMRGWLARLCTQQISRSQVIWVGGGYEKTDDLSRYPKNEDILKNEDYLKYRDNLKNDEKTLK